MLLVHSLGEDDIVLTKTARERSWRAFMEGGTTHSARASTLPYIMRRCEIEKIPYRLSALPGTGYYIEPVPENPPSLLRLEGESDADYIERLLAIARTR